MLITTGIEVLIDALSICAAKDVARLRLHLTRYPGLLTTKFPGNRYLVHEVIATGYIKVFRTLLEHARRKRQLISYLEDDLNRTTLLTAIIYDRKEVLQLMLLYSYDLTINGSLIETLESAIEKDCTQACSFYLEAFRWWNPKDLRQPFLEVIE